MGDEGVKFDMKISDLTAQPGAIGSEEIIGEFSGPPNPLPDWSDIIAQKDRQIDTAAGMIRELKIENRRLREELSEARHMADVERGRS